MPDTVPEQYWVSSYDCREAIEIKRITVVLVRTRIVERAVRYNRRTQSKSIYPYNCRTLPKNVDRYNSRTVVRRQDHHICYDSSPYPVCWRKSIRIERTQVEWCPARIGERPVRYFSFISPIHQSRDFLMVLLIVESAETRSNV